MRTAPAIAGLVVLLPGSAAVAAGATTTTDDGDGTVVDENGPTDDGSTEDDRTDDGSDERDEPDDDEPDDEPDDETLDSGEPDRTSGLNPDLRLRSADIESLDLDDDAEEYAIVRFGERVVEVADESGFSAVSTTGQEVAAESARLVRDEDDQVLVGFPADTDLREHPLVTAATDTVRDAGGEGNPQDTVELDGARRDGATLAGPRLDGVRVNRTLDRAEYRFDEDLDEDADASAFGLRTPSGRTSTATSVVAVDDDAVTVEFDTDVDDGGRFFASGGAVTDLQGNDSFPGAVGDDTNVPELTSVRQVSDGSQFDFRFSDDVDVDDVGAFEVYTDGGERYAGDSWTRVDTTIVRVAFPDVTRFADEIVFGAVDEGAVRGTGTSEAGNTVGGEAIDGARSGGGLTAGPDLEKASDDERTGQVVFRFDEEIDDDASLDPDDFRAATVDGDLIGARAVVEVDDDEVVVTFDDNIVEAADGYVVSAGAVSDNAGEASPPASSFSSSGSSSSSSRRDDDDDTADDDDDDDVGSHALTRTITSAGSSASSSGATRTHEVVRGDTLWDLAQRYDTTVERLVEANPSTIEDPALIFPGETLVIPPEGD